MREVIIPPLLTTCGIRYGGPNKTFEFLECCCRASSWLLQTHSHGYIIWGKIDIYLSNHITRQVTLPKQPVVGEIMLADGSPAMLAQKPTGLGEKKGSHHKEK